MVFYKKPQPKLPENMTVENLVPEQDTEALQAEAAALQAMLASFEEGLEEAEHDIGEDDENWKRASTLTGVDLTNMDKVTHNINSRRATGIDEAEVDEEMLERMKRRDEEKEKKKLKMVFTANGLKMVEDGDEEEEEGDVDDVSASDRDEDYSHSDDDPMSEDSSTSSRSDDLSVDSSVSRSFSSSRSDSFSAGGSIDIDIDIDSDDDDTETAEAENFFDWKMYRRESQQRLVRSLVPDLTELNLNDAETKELLLKNGVLRKSPQSAEAEMLNESGGVTFQWNAWRCLRDGGTPKKSKSSGRHAMSPRKSPNKVMAVPPFSSPQKSAEGGFNENAVLEKLDMFEGSQEKFSEDVVLEKLDMFEE